MATEFVTIREGTRLVPASAIDLETIETIRSGVPFATKVWQPRSLPHQRWYRGLVAVVAEAIGEPPEKLHENLKIRAGLYHISMVGPKRMPALILRSTSFESMDEAEFTAFTRLAVAEILLDVMRGAKRPDLIRQVDEMTGVSYQDAFREAA